MAELSLSSIGLRFHLRASHFNGFIYLFSTLKQYIEKYRHLVILRCRPKEQAIWHLKNIMTTGDLFPKIELLNGYFHSNKNKQVKNFLF